MTPTHLRSIRRKILRHHRRQGFIRQTNVVEVAVHIESGHVFLDVEFVRHVGGIEDEVEFEGVGFGPVFSRGDDEFAGAHFKGVVFFGGGVREGVDFGAEGFGPEDAEVAEAAAERVC